MESEFKLNVVLKELANENMLALEELFNFYYPRLYNFSKSFLKIEDGIDDILQEVFIRIWNNRKEIINSDTFNSYIFTITRNLLLNELRSRLNNQKLKDNILHASLAEEYASFEKVEFAELKEKVDVLINELPAKQKEIFTLSRVEGMSNKEIAEKLNISAKTVEYHISQSISIIKSKLKAFGLISLLYIYLFL